MTMHFIRQNGPSCALAALCQIRPELDYPSLCDDYLNKGWYKQREDQVAFFARLDRKYARAMHDFYENCDVALFQAIIEATSNAVPEPDLTGKGVLVVALPPGNHSVSFENGKIMDSDGPGKPETWAEFSARQATIFTGVAKEGYAAVVWEKIIRLD